QLLAERPREVAHRAGIGRAAPVHPREDLVRAVGGDAELLQHRTQESRRERVNRQRLRQSAVPPGCGPQSSSSPGKKNATSTRAVSGASDPCVPFCSTLVPKSARTVPFSALAGSVAPRISRWRAIAFSPSRTETKIGPEVMNVQRLAKN